MQLLDLSSFEVPVFLKVYSGFVNLALDPGYMQMCFVAIPAIFY